LSDRDRHKVTIARAEGREPTRPSRRLVLVGVALGAIAIGSLYCLGSSLPQSEDASAATSGSVTIETDSSTITTSASSVVSESLADQLRGFSGTLYFVGGQEDAPYTQVLTIWEASEHEPFKVDMPGNHEWESASLDASGTRLLAIDQTRVVLADSSRRKSLWVDTSGRLPAAPSFQLAAADVTGAIWHRQFPGALAWVEAEGSDRWTLKTASMNSPEGLAPHIVADFDRGVKLLWWDSTIMVLSDVPAEGGLPGCDAQRADLIVLDSTSGQVLGEGAFSFVTRLADGRLVVETAEGDPNHWAIVLTDITLTDREPSPWTETGETILWMAPSPPGNAIGGITATIENNLDGCRLVGERRLWFETEDETADFPTRSGAALWSANGRWLVVHDWNGFAWFTFIDTTEGTVTSPDLPQLGQLVAIGP